MCLVLISSSDSDGIQGHRSMLDFLFYSECWNRPRRAVYCHPHITLWWGNPIWPSDRRSDPRGAYLGLVHVWYAVNHVALYLKLKNLEFYQEEKGHGYAKEAACRVRSWENDQSGICTERDDNKRKLIEIWKWNSGYVCWRRILSMTRLGLGCAFDRPKAWRSVRCGLEPE